MRGRIEFVVIISLAAIGALWTRCAQPAAPPQQAVAASPGQASRSVWEGVYTARQASRGEAAYARECASCHGPTPKKGGEAPPLAGEEFLARWIGYNAGDLFERMRRTMPPNGPGEMSGQAVVDVLAHILSANEAPPGKTELESRTELLKQIRIEAPMPRPKRQN